MKTKTQKIKSGLELKSRPEQLSTPVAKPVIESQSAEPRGMQLGGNLLILWCIEGNPNPLADYLGQLVGATQTTAQQVNYLIGGQLAIRFALLKVDVKHDTKTSTDQFSAKAQGK